MGSWEKTGGVDFFFIVTGFMIYYLYHKYIGVPSKAGEFLLKRAIRIYPLYWIFTLLTLLFVYAFPLLEQGFTEEVILKSVFILPLKEPVIASTWSLSHVLFFYLLFSSLIYKPKIFKPIIACWMMMTAMIKLNIIPDNYSFIFSFSNLEIILGCFVAYLILNFSIRYSNLIVVLGLMGFVTVWLNNIYNVVIIHVSFFYCFFSMLIMLGIAIKDQNERKIPKSLLLLGDSSYSIYISHGAFLHGYMFILKQFHLIDMLGYFLSMCIVIILAVLSGCTVYLMIEKPLSSFIKKIMFSTTVRSKVNSTHVKPF